MSGVRWWLSGVWVVVGGVWVKPLHGQIRASVILGPGVFVCFVYSRLSNLSATWRLSPLPLSGLQI
jgi:hypothetical protein